MTNPVSLRLHKRYMCGENSCDNASFWCYKVAGKHYTLSPDLMKKWVSAIDTNETTEHTPPADCWRIWQNRQQAASSSKSSTTSTPVAGPTQTFNFNVNTGENKTDLPEVMGRPISAPVIEVPASSPPPETPLLDLFEIYFTERNLRDREALEHTFQKLRDDFHDIENVMDFNEGNWTRLHVAEGLGKRITRGATKYMLQKRYKLR